MSRPSSTSTYSGTAFPKQAGAALLSPDKVGEQLSPAHSHFSFTSSPRSVQDIDDGSRDSTGDAPGLLRPMTSRARAQFYEDQFSYKVQIASAARDRVTKDAPIIAELKTNVIIKDEYTLVTDLSHHLSTRYQRPEASIMITVNHSACLLLGGSFEPTYILTINALPVQVQPVTNKRNAALIQTFMAESIGVPSDRGIIKFVAIAEETLATNGMTILGEIEKLERLQSDETGGSNIKRAMTKSSRKTTVGKAKSTMQLSRALSKADPASRAAVTSNVPHNGPLDSGVDVNEKAMGEDEMSNKKSEPLPSKLSKNSNSKANANMIPPPTPADRHVTSGIGKRKSFMKVFRL